MDKSKGLQEDLSNNIKKYEKGNKTQEQKKRRILIFFLMEDSKPLNFMIIIPQ